MTTWPSSGIGGIGINAVQGAKLAGARQIFAIDPVPFKRDQAIEFGATHTAASLEEAQALIGEATAGPHGQQGDHDDGRRPGRHAIGAALAVTAKRGRVVVTNLHAATETQVTMSALDSP